RRLTLLLGAVWSSFLLVIAGGLWSAIRGVAEARRGAERIAESEKTLRRVADNATDLVRIIDDHANNVYVSPSCKRILGFSEAEVLATSPRGLLPEEERAAALEMTRRIKAKETETAVFTHRLRTKEGGYRWFETTLGLVQAGLDQTPHVHLTSRDITERRAAEEALQHQTARLESILSSMADGVAVFDEHNRMLMVNPAAHDYLRYEQGEALAADWPARHRAYQLDGTTPFPADQGPLTRALGGEACSVQLVLHDKLDRPRAFSVTASPIREGEGHRTGCVAVYREITEQRKAARDLAESEERLRLLSEASFEGVALTHAGVIVDVNENFASWLGRSRSELIGTAGLACFAPEHHDELKLKSTLSEARYEADLLRRDGTRLPVEVRGRALNYRGEPMRIAVVRDMTERRLRDAELKEHAEKLRLLSLRDELTGLYNRRGFLEHAQQALRHATRNKRAACVFYADLNGMKVINDSLGHEVGDRAIVATSRLLSAVFRDADIVARLGGDEFAIFASESGAGDVGSIAARLFAEVDAWNGKGAEAFQLSVSIGSSVFEPAEPLALAELMERADREMYAQKRARRNVSSRVLSA
ncbi:MAG TPA: PAS domain S-box protein, partial [Polyangiaceae bacterium]|nr:PAS domain S-box protein [Polyangiaceae bacterium]